MAEQTQRPRVSEDIPSPEDLVTAYEAPTNTVAPATHVLSFRMCQMNGTNSLENSVAARSKMNASQWTGDVVIHPPPFPHRRLVI